MQLQPTSALLYHCVWGLVGGAATVGATTVVRGVSDSFVAMAATVVAVVAAMVFLEHARSPLRRGCPECADRDRIGSPPASR